VLDHVAFGPLAENPARKDAIPFVVALILHRQLDEGAGFGRVFPRRGLLAGAQADDRTAHARRIARLHLQLADQPVALVEQAEHRDAFGHRGRPLDPADFLRHAFGAHRLGLVDLYRRAAVAGGEPRRREQRRKRDRKRAHHRAGHSAPGRQAS
jgi:hypothetical protein